MQKLRGERKIAEEKRKDEICSAPLMLIMYWMIKDLTNFLKTLCFILTMDKTYKPTCLVLERLIDPSNKSFIIIQGYKKRSLIYKLELGLPWVMLNNGPPSMDGVSECTENTTQWSNSHLGDCDWYIFLKKKVIDKCSITTLNFLHHVQTVILIII